jgi:hypothetical protein
MRKLHPVLTYGAPICAQPGRDSHISTKLKTPWRDVLGSCGEARAPPSGGAEQVQEDFPEMMRLGLPLPG